MSTQDADSVLAGRAALQQLLLHRDAHHEASARSADTTAYCPAAPTAPILGRVCLACAGIPEDYRCTTCDIEGQIYRGGQCARCALRDDLTALMVDGAADPVTMGTIVDILCGVDRPESILSWKRSPIVRALLTGLAGGDIPLSHDGLDAAGQGRQVSHLRSLLEHNGLLPHRDEPLARFECWLASKLDAICEPAVRAPVEQFATWHHLHRLRRNSTPGQTSAWPNTFGQTRDHRDDQVPYLAA